VRQARAVRDAEGLKKTVVFHSVEIEISATRNGRSARQNSPGAAHFLPGVT